MWKNKYLIDYVLFFFFSFAAAAVGDTGIHVRAMWSYGLGGIDGKPVILPSSYNPLKVSRELTLSGEH